jgi:paired amphipathic helix protein Sin3a
MEDIRRQAEQRDRDMRHRQSTGEQQILHQPVAVPPHVQGVHGPNGLLGSQGAAAASLMAAGPGMGNVPAIFSSAPHHPGAVALQAQPPPQQQPQVLMPFPPVPLGPGAQLNQAQQPILNDALSYLDQVKGQFQDHPDVYNRFLDIMKEFKSGAIDTPGVIERVSQLFAGNPALIQGFNTFLPPGYRIECGLNDDPNAIRVTTPMGTTHSTLQARPSSPRSHGAAANAVGPYQSTTNQGPWAAQQHPVGLEPVTQESRLPPVIYGQPPGPSNVSPDALREQLGGPMSQDQRTVQALSHGAAVLRGNIGIPATTPTDNMAPLGAALANGGTPIPAGPGGAVEKRGPVEFNHAISYVNKIKNRFASQPDIYKQFLEILQTYQRESKPIGDVYAQVTRLFESAPDLLEDFKQFLPESAAHANAISRRQATEDVFAISNTRAEPGYPAAANSTQAAHLTPRVDQQRLPPMGNFAPTPSSSKDNKRKRTTDRQPPVMAPISATDPNAVSNRAGFGQHVSKVCFKNDPYPPWCLFHHDCDEHNPDADCFFYQPHIQM